MSLLCWHRKTTTPRRDKDGEYVACLCCSARIPWRNWDLDVIRSTPVSPMSRVQQEFLPIRSTAQREVDDLEKLYRKHNSHEHDPRKF